MAWQELITNLRGSGDGRAGRVADLLEMDLAGTTNGSAEGTAYGDRFGDHISAAYQTHFGPTVEAVRATLGPDMGRFLSDLERPFLFNPALRVTSFELPCNLANRIGTAEEVWGPGAVGVRYVPIVDFLHYFLGIDPYSPGFPAAGDPARARAARDRIEDGKRSFAHPKRFHANIGNPTNGRVWVTHPTATAPHEAARTKGLSEADACTYVVQRMGLMGYETPLRWAERIGMVALGYPLMGHVYLYRPTVADAMVHPLFYPAPKGARRGETLPLAADLSAPSPRSEAGEPEWIHANFKVVLVEDNPTPGDCAILWYGTA